jgi:hypothetical protein
MRCCARARRPAGGGAVRAKRAPDRWPAGPEVAVRGVWAAAGAIVNGAQARPPLTRAVSARIAPLCDACDRSGAHTGVSARP